MLCTYVLSVVPDRFPQTQCLQKHANGDKRVGPVSSALAAFAVLQWIWCVVPPCALNAAGFYCLSSFFVFRTKTACCEYDNIYSSFYYAAMRPFSSLCKTPLHWGARHEANGLALTRGTCYLACCLELAAAVTVLQYFGWCECNEAMFVFV